MSVYFEILKMKTPINQDKVPEEIFSNSQPNCRKISFESGRYMLPVEIYTENAPQANNSPGNQF